MATSTTSDDRADAVSVLVVYDDPIEARFVAESLALADPAVTTRRETDPDAAVTAVADDGVDCVVLGAAVGDVAGVDLLDRIARTDAAVRAVIHTDVDDPDLARRAWDRGAAYARKDPEIDRYDALAGHVVGRADPSQADTSE